MMKTTNYKICAITATNNIAVAMFANKKYAHKVARNNKVALLEMFKAILNKAKDNSELMDEPVLVITTQSILKGFTTGTFVEYIRTGCDASGNAFAEDEMQLINECAELLATRTFNVRLIDEKMISPKDQVATQIKRNAFDTVKLLAKNSAVKNTQQQVAQQPATETQKTIALINSQIQQALKEGNVVLATELSKMLGNITNPQPVQETNEVEVPEDVKEQPLTDEELAQQADEIDM